jgi:hypothetical protein
MQAVKLLFAAIVAFTLLAEFAESNEAAKYYEQVIYIESMRYRAHWLDSHHSGWAGFTQAPERDLIGKIWSKWMVRRGSGGAISLESVRYPNHYLDAHHSGWVGVTYSAYPSGADWALWYMEKRSDGNMVLRSKRYSKSRVDAHHTGWAAHSEGSGIWHALRIYTPSTDETKALISMYDNTQGNTVVKHTFREKIGISKSESTNIEITNEIGGEIKKSFTINLSTTWSHSSTETWEKEIERTIEVEVLPGYVKRIYQMKGNYGPFEVSCNQLFFEDSTE